MPDKVEDDKKPVVKEKKNGHGPTSTADLASELGDVPSIPPPPVSGPWRSYKEVVSQLATRIVEAQRPIRVLNAIRWDDSVEDQLRKSRYKEMPKVDYEGIE